MSLGDDQRRFTLLKAHLVLWAYLQGYELSEGDSYRDPRVHGKYGEKKGYGHSRSFHKKRLAQDYNLFKDGKYLSSTEDHGPIGKYWKSLDPKCSWGGDFDFDGDGQGDDGNHYSYGEKR